MAKTFFDAENQVMMLPGLPIMNRRRPPPVFFWHIDNIGI
jgi:hypothetical protein